MTFISTAGRKTVYVRVRSGRRLDRFFRLRGDAPRAFGRISIGTRPKSWVYVDGRRLGKTPLFNKRVPVGRRRFEFRAIPYGVRYTTKFTVVKGKQKLIHKFRWGRLHIFTLPRAKIELPGGTLGYSRKCYRVPAGRYRLQLVFPDGTRVRKVGTVRPGGHLRMSHTL